jgi:hypothetical protein
LATGVGDKGDKASAVTPSTTHTISIYQNAEYVAGLVQQLFNSPLVTQETRENAEDKTRNVDVSSEVAATAAGQANVPFVAKGKLDGKGSAALALGHVVSTGTKSTQNFVYSQAYYLALVRRTLKEQGQLVQVGSLKDAESLKPGMFVEYQAQFSASILTGLMDVLAPDLISAIVRNRVKVGEAQLFSNYDSWEAVQAASARAELLAEAHGELATSITRAVKADFRQDNTREYLGRIADGKYPVTAVTICDEASFTIADQDRILDGSYRVLGKVVSEVASDVPALKRNKLLGALDPELIDGIYELAQSSLKDLTTSPVPGLDMQKAFDVDLKSRVAGPSFSVIPIAIFA